MLEGSEVVASSITSEPSSNLSPMALSIPKRRRLGRERGRGQNNHDWPYKFICFRLKIEWREKSEKKARKNGEKGRKKGKSEKKERKKREKREWWEKKVRKRWRNFKLSADNPLVKSSTETSFLPGKKQERKRRQFSYAGIIFWSRAMASLRHCSALSSWPIRRQNTP